MSTKKLIAFDLDDTLAISKAPISDRMGELLVKLLEKYEVCIISGGKYEQFQKQVVSRLEATPQLLGRLHLMPTCGTRYYRYDGVSSEWTPVYIEDLSTDEKKRIVEIAEKAARESGIWPEKPYGDVIEDRGSQISISLLGQEAPADEKHDWAAKNSEKRMALRNVIAEQLLDFEVRAGGTTTIDITRLGIDKAYGMHKLVENLGISKDEILFMGDKLEEGGNDYPVKAMGIDCLDVDRWEDTARVLEGVLYVS